MAFNIWAVARNRKVICLLAAIALVYSVLLTLSNRGMSINYESKKPHSEEFSYSTASEILSRNEVVSDVYIQKCGRGFTCAIPKGSTVGHWEKIPTKLNLFSKRLQLFNYYMYVEKSPMAQAEKFIINVAFANADEEPEKSSQESKFIKHKISSSEFMWLEYLEEVEFQTPIVRDINVFFGKDDMKDSRRYWKFEPGAIPIPGTYSTHARISMLSVAVKLEVQIVHDEHKFNSVLKKNEILLSTADKFKVIQISDMHIGQDSGKCFEECKFDIATLDFIRSAIDKEGDVQLVVVTGDMIDFDRTVHHESVVLKALSPILERNLPFIFVFGDTDYDKRNYLTKINMHNFIASLPGCYNKKISNLDHRLHGLTNGNIMVHYIPQTPNGEPINTEDLPSKHADALITYLDSENMMVKDSQANYVFRLNTKKSAQTERKLIFLHNPLPNFRPQGLVKLIGNYNERHPLVTHTSQKLLGDLRSNGYKVVAVGHEHENDACIWDESDSNRILLCYSGVTGESGVTRLDPLFERRLRVFEIDFNNDRILSWKRNKEMSLDPQEIWSAPGAA